MFKKKTEMEKFADALKVFERKYSEYLECKKHFQHWLDRAKAARQMDDNLAIIKFVATDFNYVVRSIHGWQHDYEDKVNELNRSYDSLKSSCQELAIATPLFIQQQLIWAVYLSTFKNTQNLMKAESFKAMITEAKVTVRDLYEKLTANLQSSDADYADLVKETIKIM